MNYVEQALEEDEIVLYDARLSVWSLIDKGLLGAVLVCALALPGLWGALPFFFGIGLWLVALLKWASVEIALTNRRVIAAQGVISRRTIELSLGRIEGIEVQQTISQRLGNFGTILIAGTGSHKARLSDIADPMSFRRAFLGAVENFNRQPAVRDGGG
jgi:uncharacterized membrane protein YdbT with pleckstrin-like domain